MKPKIIESVTKPKKPLKRPRKKRKKLPLQLMNNLKNQAYASDFFMLVFCRFSEKTSSLDLINRYSRSLEVPVYFCIKFRVSLSIFTK